VPNGLLLQRRSYNVSTPAGEAISICGPEEAPGRPPFKRQTMDTRIVTASTDLSRVLSANSTTVGTSIANPADTAVEPSLGVIPMGKEGVLASNGLVFYPYGVGSAAQTFLMSVFGWEYIHPKVAQNAGRWTATPLATFLCTLCTLAGSAGGEVDENQLYCGTIALVIGGANISNEIISPTGNMKACIRMDAFGCKLVQPLFAINASATSCNALWKKI